MSAAIENMTASHRSIVEPSTTHECKARPGRRTLVRVVETASPTVRRVHPATKCLIAFLLLIGTHRSTLIDRGLYFWGDEVRFVRAVDAVDDMARGEYRSAARQLFRSLGRPGFVLLGVIPAAMGRMIGGDATSDLREISRGGAAANVAVSLAVTVLVYLLASTWSNKPWYGLLAAVAYSLLAQANVWIRHLVPYNHSLALFLLALWMIVREPGAERGLKGGDSHRAEGAHRIGVFRFTMAGAISALAFATYPGHYAFVLVNLVAVWVVGPPRWKAVGLYFAGGAVLALLIEVVAQFAGTSWLGGAGRFSPTMGLFTEGFVFAWRYLWEAEGWAGIVLGLLFVAGLLADRHGLVRWFGSFLSRRSHAAHAPSEVDGSGTSRHLGRFGASGTHPTPAWRKSARGGFAQEESARAEARGSPSWDGRDVVMSSRWLIPILVAAVGCYLLHAAAGVFFQKTVFYGRVLLMYLPLMVIGAAVFVSGLRSNRIRRGVVLVWVAASVTSFASFTLAYQKVEYPHDVWYTSIPGDSPAATVRPDVLYGTIDASPEGIMPPDSADFVMVADPRPEGSDAYVRLAPHEEAVRSNARFIGVNIRWMFYIQERYDRFADPSGYRLIVSAVHPLAFPPMQFEGFRPCERKRFREREYSIRIYERE